MRALPIAVTAVAAALVLTACSDNGGGGGTKKASAAPSASTACQVGRVGIKVGPGNAATTAGDTGNVPVTLTNHGGAACTLKGFPRIALSGSEASWTVAQLKDAQPEKLTLKPDETAGFTITYVRGAGGGSAKSASVSTLKVALPGGTDDRSFAWSYGAVALLSESEPNASVGPFQTAGD